MIDKVTTKSQAGKSPAAKPQPDADRSAHTRQLFLTASIMLLAAWIALPFLTPIAWGAILAIVEWPLYERAHRHWPRHPFYLALAFTVATGLLVVLPLSIAAVSLAQESQTAIAWLQHAQQFGAPPPGWLEGLPLIGSRMTRWWQEHVGSPQAANELLNNISADSALGWTRSIASEVATDSALFLVTLVLLATFLTRGHRIAAQSLVLAKRMFGVFGEDFEHRLIGAVRSTVIGTVFVSFIEGTLIGIAYVVAGVPQALLFATFTILLALVPFGAWAAFGLASLILIGSGSALAGALLFTFSVIVMTVGDNVVQPLVVGRAVELPVIMALIGAFGGLAVLGLVGLFIGPVIMAALLLVCQEWLIAPGEKAEKAAKPCR